ncbi:TRAP transporter substrate-binding protein [Aquimarina sp. M1]
MKIKRLLLLSIGLFVFGSCATKNQTKILRLAHTLDTKHPVHKAMVILGEKLEKKSNGTLKVKLYPSGQLGAERECLELLQIGSLDVTKVSAAVLENFITEYKVFSIPYLFRDRSHAFQVFDGSIGNDMLTKGDKYRLRGLTFYDAGSRSFYTKEKPIKTPGDLQGLKIRVQKSNMAVAMVNSLGGSPTPISWGELYTALQQGVVDGAENNLPSFYTSKHYEICKYFSMDQHTSVPDVLLIGLDTWERLSQQEQIWLKEAARESTEEQRRLWADSEKESLDAITASGVEIITPDTVLFEKKTESIQTMFQDDPEMLSLIKNIKNTNQ